MGLKRWLLALIILFIVLGFIVFFFFQSGADHHIRETVLPRLEKQYGILFTYESVSVSLTAVSFSNVRLTPVSGGGAFARVDRLSVQVRVGPLLLGNLSISGIRMEGLKILMGTENEGAGIAEWRDLLSRLLPRPSSGISERKGLSIPEMYIASGSIALSRGKWNLRSDGLSGRVTPGNQSHLQIQQLRGSLRTAWVATKQLEVMYDGREQQISVGLQKPEFEFPVDGDSLHAMRTDAEELLSDLGLISDREMDADPQMISEEEYPEGNLRFTGGGGDVVTREVNRVRISEVMMELGTNRQHRMSMRMHGVLTDTRGQFAAQISIPRKGKPLFTLEFEKLAMAAIGPLALSADAVDWSAAKADGQVKVTVESNGKRVVEGQTSLYGMGLQHPRISAERLSDLGGNVDFRMLWFPQDHMLSLDRFHLTRNQVRLSVTGTTRTDRLAFDVIADVPPTSCRQLLHAIPAPLRQRLEGLELEGRIGFQVRMALDLLDPESLVLDGTLDNRCKIARYGNIPEPDTYRRVFSWTAYDEKKAPKRLMSGPGTHQWTPLSRISPYVISAVLTTEDGKFGSHAGMTLPEIRTAMVMNLKKGGMYHGASTITMQLAKNLFLSRERTLARKLEELFFTWYLESNFTKDEILEMYLNIVEFGPSLYGVGTASVYYFGRPPHELNLVESVFLVRLLPSPVARHDALKKRGTLSARTMASLHRVMSIMHRRGHISDGELRIGKEQQLVFYREGDPLPEPRYAIRRDTDAMDLSLPPSAADWVEEFEDAANWE
jgi:hypothetical protein